jgi:hypothetical protein
MRTATQQDISNRTEIIVTPFEPESWISSGICTIITSLVIAAAASDSVTADNTSSNNHPHPH